MSASDAGEAAVAYVIAQPCVGVKDGACLTVCPVDCIAPGRDDAAFREAAQLYIDARECICCALCVSACPAGAIFAEEDLPAEWAGFAAANARHFAVD